MSERPDVTTPTEIVTQTAGVPPVYLAFNKNRVFRLGQGQTLNLVGGSVELPTTAKEAVLDAIAEKKTLLALVDSTSTISGDFVSGVILSAEYLNQISIVPSINHDYNALSSGLLLLGCGSSQITGGLVQYSSIQNSYNCKLTAPPNTPDIGPYGDRIFGCCILASRNSEITKSEITDVEHSVIISGFNCHINFTGNSIFRGHSILSAIDSSITTNGNYNSIIGGSTNLIDSCNYCVTLGNNNSIIGRNSCLVWNGGTVTANGQCALKGDVFIQGGNLTVENSLISLFLNSNGGTVDPTSLQSSVINSNTCTISGAFLRQSVILASYLCNLGTDSAVTVRSSAVITSQSCSLYNTFRSSVINSLASSVTVGDTASNYANEIRISESDTCTITAGRVKDCFISGSTTCNLTSPLATSLILGGSSIVSSNLCTISATSGGAPKYSSLYNSQNSSITSVTRNTQNTVGLALWNSTLTDCVRVVAIGLNNTVNNRTDCLVWNGGTVTADGQCALNGDVFVQNGDLTVQSGGIYETARTGVTTATLTDTDSLIYLPSGFTTLTLPLASSFTATTARYRKFKIVSQASASAPVVNTTAPDTFFKKTGWTQYRFKAVGETKTLLLYIDPTPANSFWTFQTATDCYISLYTNTPNNFGVAPPKSDANQLPTSTSQATHEALTTTSYVTFDTVLTAQTQAITLANPGFTLNISGTYTVTYQFDIRNVSGGGNYLLRCDMVNTTTGVPLPGSYAEVGGTNTLAGSQRVHVSPQPLGFVPPATTATYQLRISQDSGNTINASASIPRIAIELNGYI